MTTTITTFQDDLFPRSSLTLHEHIGFELGWDYAHHGTQPPAPYDAEPSPLRHGLLAGRAAFGQRTLPASRHVRKWLQLRLHAWLRGRSVELVQVTPNLLQQIEVEHCPVTRVALTHATLQPSDASIDRVRNDAGYAAGNLAVMSTQANHAKGSRGFRDAIALVRRMEAGGTPTVDGVSAARSTPTVDGLSAARTATVDGLSAAEWARVAVLCSFVEPLEHEEAAALPLLVLPPNRLRLFNPVQALQAFVSRQLLSPGWSQRIARLDALVPGKPARRAFQMFFHALLPRVLERAGRQHTPQALRWAVEDAWRNPLVLKRWTAFARQLSAADCERLVERAGARGLGTQRVVQLPPARATDGWALESRGYVPHALMTPAGTAQASLPL